MEKPLFFICAHLGNLWFKSPAIQMAFGSHCRRGGRQDGIGIPSYKKTLRLCVRPFSSPVPVLTPRFCERGYGETA